MTSFSQIMKDLSMLASLDTPFENLSNSDKRKVCIGVTLLAISEVIILEEPTRDLSLDDANRVRF